MNTDKYYDKYKRNKKARQFYASKEWKKARLIALNETNYLCKWCLETGRHHKADVVHHIVEIEEDWELRLELSNLAPLCHFHHNNHHKSSSNPDEELQQFDENGFLIPKN